MSPSPLTVAVIGAGAVGASTALRLALDGHAVTVFERDPSGARASFGNAGHIGAASVVPWANPVNRRGAMGYRRDPLHPLRFSNADMVRHGRWVARWLAASSARRAEAGAHHLKALLDQCFPPLNALLDAAGARDLLRQDGLLHVFASEASWQGAAPGFDQRERLGIPVERLKPGELGDLEPALAFAEAEERIARAVLLPTVGQILNPHSLVERYLAALETRGGVVRQGAVSAIVPTEGAVRVETDGGATTFDRVVIAAGVASAQLAKPLGATVPLIAERGYHLQFSSRGDLLRRSVLYVDSRVVFSPMNDGIRMTTGAEFTRPDAPPAFEAMDRIFKAARPLLPDLPPHEEAVPWVGSRPSSPDSMPVIGRTPRSDLVLCAYGHGHSGLTMAAPTAMVVADLIAGRPPSVDLGPYAPGRGI
ncbi:MAG: FAD-dependent oxidoreductase [Pseudomonadota bacterium]